MAPSTIPSCCLTVEQKDALIDAVHDRPVIWDCSRPDYQDVQNRRRAFSEVAALLSDGKSRYTGPEMQVEWKKLRDIFNRTLKKVVSQGGTDTEVTWRYWQKLQFIADHERSQIFKAMQKWSKKMPSGSPTKRRLIASNRRLNRRISREETSTASSASMVQQLADVAQTARQLLGMEKEEEPKEDDEEDGNEEEQSEQGDDEQQQQSCGAQSSRAPLDPLGQILLLGSQMQNTPGTLGGMDQQQQDAFGELLTMKAENGEFPKLLNELLAKGAVEAAEINGRTKTNGVKRARLHEGDGEGRPRMEQQQSGIVNVWAQQQGGTNGTDQFDIFGMFIASQVRTLHSQSAQTALRLKRALTEVCFQFEADLEENN